MIAQQLYQSGCRVSERLRRDVTEEEMQMINTVMKKMQRNLDEVLTDMEGKVKEYD